MISSTITSFVPLLPLPPSSWRLSPSPHIVPARPSPPFDRPQSLTPWDFVDATQKPLLECTDQTEFLRLSRHVLELCSAFLSPEHSVDYKTAQTRSSIATFTPAEDKSVVVLFSPLLFFSPFLRSPSKQARQQVSQQATKL